MQSRPLLATLAAALLALPLAGYANTGKATHANSASTQANASNDGGAEAMFKSLDKNGDGFLSKDEVAGSPHAAEFAKLDKNGDGKLSRAEHANAPDHVAARTGNKSASSSDTSGSKKTY
jgi:hypothetical protein